MTLYDPEEVLFTLAPIERAAVRGLLDGMARAYLAVKDTIPYHRVGACLYTGLPIATWEGILEAGRPGPDPVWVVVYHRPHPAARVRGAVGRILAGLAPALEAQRARDLEATLDREPMSVWRM